MKYLVDANVLWEATRPVPDGPVLDWLRRHERELVIDPVVLGEIRLGILLAPAGRRRRALEQWFQAGVKRIVCLSWTPETALCWARLVAERSARMVKSESIRRTLSSLQRPRVLRITRLPRT